jgi:hypothetical protein
VMARRSLTCHDGAKKTAGIDLSTAATARAVMGKPADDPAANRLVRVIVQGKMPPTGRLPAEEIAALRQWVRAGAAYAQEPLQAQKISDQPLWSLEPVRRPAVPTTPYDRLARNPIDRFIFAKLAAQGLKPSPLASRLALIRRVTVDLTGLPPTPEEIQAFISDTAPNAYQKVVERLLASPAYGERWGRHWLDVVRFGESQGYEQNHLRANAWPYRDYVIRSFNEDKPYDRFVKEQLAGDVLGKGDPNVEVATGFLVAGVHDTVGNQTEEGSRQQRANDLDDMVATTSETFLGLTAGCAKCHDHKFDPIPQRDYYRLAAVFAAVRHGERAIASRESGAVRQSEDLTRQVRATDAEIAALDTQARASIQREQGTRPAPRPAVSPQRNVEEFAPVLARFVRFTVTATRDGSQPCIDELELYGPDSERNLALAPGGAKATASSLLPGYPMHQIPHLNDGRYGNDFSWISNEAGAGWAQIELPQPARVSRVAWSRDGSQMPRFEDRVARAYRVEVSEDGRQWQTVATEAGRASKADEIAPERLLQALPPAQRARRTELAASLKELRGRMAALEAARTAYVGQFTTPDPIYLLKRGDVMQRQEEVTPGALSRIPGLPGELLPPGGRMETEPERRIALANWLTDPRNPLTPRVMVNRIWHAHFGRGIVATPSDFGHNGEPPTHPELLDWLASDFVAGGGNQSAESRRPSAAVPGSGFGADTHTPTHLSSSAQTPDTRNPKPWSMKRLHRMIVTSYTYCQSSAPNPAGLAKDAGDRLLWRMPLRRVEAEGIRDAILAASGKLDRRMGGPGYPLFKYRVVNVAIYEPLEQYGPETWRRSVYQQAARGIKEDLLGSFDCPDSSQRAPRRSSTTTALQALSLLNGPFALQQSGLMAERVRKEAGEKPAAQVERAFRLAFGRAPDPAERAAALGLVSQYGLATLCRGLINANEFLYF